MPNRLGPVARELWRLKDCDVRELYCGLSHEARDVQHGASLALTGYAFPNEYWLPQVMSEAIEAAEALGL